MRSKVEYFDGRFLSLFWWDSSIVTFFSSSFSNWGKANRSITRLESLPVSSVAFNCRLAGKMKRWCLGTGKLSADVFLTSRTTIPSIIAASFPLRHWAPYQRPWLRHTPRLRGYRVERSRRSIFDVFLLTFERKCPSFVNGSAGCGRKYSFPISPERHVHCDGSWASKIPRNL